jgi:hypothetical protein
MRQGGFDLRPKFEFSFEELLEINYNPRPRRHTLGWCDIPTFLKGGNLFSPSLVTHPIKRCAIDIGSVVSRWLR